LDGQQLWVEAAPTINHAKIRVRELLLSAPAKYLVFDQRTGNKTAIEPENQKRPPGKRQGCRVEES
jgi:hypothetical protein